MRTKLTWLHISDIHFHPKTEWRDNSTRDSLINYLKKIFENDNTLRPDLVFCTGDIAFGETDSSPLADQYEQAEGFFDELLAACGQKAVPLPKERLFVVPGNHDINRKSVNSDAQETLTRWAQEANEHVQEINQRFNDRPDVFTQAIKRLDEYAKFVQDYLPHQHDEDVRHCFARIIDIEGLKVGIAGFNSAWSCAGPEDERAVWLAAEWQFNAAQRELKDTVVRIGLMHHPVDWLNSADRDIATPRISTDFHLWLHGHDHNAWVVPAQSNITIAAGAVGAQDSEEFGINLVKIDLSKSNGTVYLHQHKAGEADWTIAPIAGHAPEGQWPLENLPSGLLIQIPVLSPPAPTPETPAKRTPRLFGRESLLREARDKLNRHPFLLVYGLRGNGKSSLIRELSKDVPLAGKELVFFNASKTTKANELFRQIATLLGETAEFPQPPQGDVTAIAAEIQRRYPNPRTALVWIDSAHHLLNSDGFRDLEVHNLLLGLQAALGTQWHWLLELRERPPQDLLGTRNCTCEVPGLDKASLADCLGNAAPVGREADWYYTGPKLKTIYQWLGGGHGNQAHPQAIQLLIEVARGRKETPLEVLQRHRGALEEKIEEKLLGDLYHNVLNPFEQNMLQALALYRTSIPHDHADILERNLRIPGAWDGLDLRCLLSSSADHSLYFLHSFIAGWVRTRCLGYAGHGDDTEANFLETTTADIQKCAQAMHMAIATCWLEQLGGRRRATNLNIGRALEAFHHLVSAGEAERVRDIAVDLLSGNIDWARRRMETLSDHLFKTKAPIAKRRKVLEYWAVLEPEGHKVQRFLGQIWQKKEGNGSDKALLCFEKACRLRPDFPPYWADLGKTLLARGHEGAVDFLLRLEVLEKDCPKAINDHVRSIQSSCFNLVGESAKAASLRMARINAGSRHAAFYTYEAKVRLETGDLNGALVILDLADKHGCVDEFTESTRATVLQQTDPAKAASMRMARINAGSRHAGFYTEEAKVRLQAGDSQGALDILDLATKNGCSNEFTESTRASVLQQTDPEKAASLRMAKINAGSWNAGFYADEAKVRLQAGDFQGALKILDLATKNGCADDFTEAIRASVFQQTDPKKAASLRMAKINAGSRNAVFYADEAKARLAADDSQGALKILDLATKNGCVDNFTAAIRATVFQQTDPEKAASLRMARINTGICHATFYNDEAKARLAADDSQGALEILDLATKNGCADDFTEAIRASVFQQTDPEKAASLRMAKINAGSRNAVFYADEAKARLAAGDSQGALKILALAEKNGCNNYFTESIRGTTLRELRTK